MYCTAIQSAIAVDFTLYKIKLLLLLLYIFGPGITLNNKCIGAWLLLSMKLD